MSCQRIRGIYTAVLTARATKTYHQAFKAPFNVFFYRDIYDIKNAVEKLGHLRLLFQEVFHFLVAAAFCFHVFNPAGI